MAKRANGKRRFPKRYIRGVVNAELTSSVLTGKTASSAAFPEVVTEQARISSILASWALTNFTPFLDSGPMMVGLAHSDYSVAEIEEYIENVDSWDEGDLVQSREIGRRLIRILGIFDNPVAVTDSISLNDGKPIKTKLNWQLASGQTLRLWVYNTGSASIATAVKVDGRGHANLWPN